MKRILILSTCLGLFACQEDIARKSTRETAIPVHTLEFGKDLGQSTLEFSGTLQENRSVPIAFQVSGRIIAVSVQEGDTLREGQSIASVDSTSFLDAYQLNQAKLRQAKDAYQRMKPMHDSGSVTEVKWVELETGVAQAEAMANLARKNLEDSRLAAPVSGIVIHKKLEIGQIVTPGIPVLSLVDSRFVDAVFAVPETEVLYLHPGMPMQISTPGAADDILRGVISEVAIQADQVSRNYAVRVRLDNSKGRLRMGMACHGEVQYGKQNKNQAILPVQAVLETPEGNRYVYVVRNNKAIRQDIQVGGFLGKGLRVVSGLSPGERVIIEGVHGLTNGTAVQE